LAVSDFERSKSFFLAALAPLDISLLPEVTAEQTGGDAHVGFGADGKPIFWIGNGKRPAGGLHVALHRPVAIPGRGVPSGGSERWGPRQWRARIAAALPSELLCRLLDPDGNNIEAVCHQAE
jgi:hypothetical protein